MDKPQIHGVRSWLGKVFAQDGKPAYTIDLDPAVISPEVFLGTSGTELARLPLPSGLVRLTWRPNDADFVRYAADMVRLGGWRTR